MIRPRGGTTRRNEDRQEMATSRVFEVGARLREARRARDLDLLAVHDRIHRPITVIEALEEGNLDALPDRALARSTLRRYAAFLDLDGEELTSLYAEAWGPDPVDPDESVTRSTPAVTGVVAAVATGPDHLRAFTQTGPVPRVGRRTAAATSGFEASTGPPTGTFPVVPHKELRKTRRALARARRRRRAPVTLKIATWTAAVLLVAVAAGTVLYLARPRLLVQAHILRLVPPGPAGSGVAPAATVATGAQPAQSRTPVQPVASNALSSTYTVITSHFAVTVATSGPCWVQITSSSSSVPLVSAVEPAGKVLDEPASGTMTVQVGSSAVAVGVQIGGKSAFFTVPHAAPFTYIFRPATAA